jgi:hypothetical protein
VIENHFSKGIHLIAAQESCKAEEFAFVFFNCFIRHHGLPEKIISDRVSIFLSKSWKEVQQLLQVRPAPSTAWHPRLDGQTEWTNQTVETFLHHFVLDQQDNWFNLLPIAELVFNSSVSSSTGFSPFFVQSAFHPQTNMFNKGSKVPAADQFLENIISIQDTLQDNIHQAKEIQKRYFDNRTQEVPTYQAGDWVWLI